MSGIISGNMVGSYSQLGKTLLLVDADGNQIPGVIVDHEVVFTAGDNDVREGIIYASSDGVSTGTKTIPSYHTTDGCKVVLANTEFTISVPEYNYDNLFIVITSYDESISKSLVSTYVAIDGAMYAVGDNTKVSDIIIDDVNERINLGIIATEKSVVRYLVTREEY